MTDSNVYISRFSAWAPGVDTSAGWHEWSLGERKITLDSKGPELAFTEPMFRRRLSQISKMTIQVVHDLMPITNDIKIMFASFRGELSRQYQINKMLIEDKTLSPAVFSLSVFNAPAALATMAFGLKGGYSAIYINENSFSSALKAANAALLCAEAEELVFIYADEKVQDEYSRFFNKIAPPVSFALLLSKVSCPNSIPFNITEENHLDYLKQLLKSGGNCVSP